VAGGGGGGGGGRGLLVVVDCGKLPNMVFLFMAWCILVGGYQRFGATPCLLLHDVRNEDNTYSETWASTNVATREPQKHGSAPPCLAPDHLTSAV